MAQHPKHLPKSQPGASQPGTPAAHHCEAPGIITFDLLNRSHYRGRSDMCEVIVMGATVVQKHALSALIVHCNIHNVVQRGIVRLSAVMCRYKKDIKKLESRGIRTKSEIKVSCEEGRKKRLEAGGFKKMTDARRRQTQK